MSRSDQLGFSLVELADATDLSPRTIHYYSSQGLLPPADRRGAGARYPRVTLDRLRAILRFKNEARLTLQEIRRILAGLSEGQLARVASGDSSPFEFMDEGAGEAPNGAGSEVASAHKRPAQLPSTPPPSRPAALHERRHENVRSQEMPAEGAALAPRDEGLDLPVRDAPRVGGEATEQLGSLLRTLELGAGRSVPRAGSRDHWVSIPITADLQISAHRVSGEDIEKLRRIADHIRALLVAGFAGPRDEARRRPEGRPEGRPEDGPGGPSGEVSTGA